MPKGSPGSYNGRMADLNSENFYRHISKILIILYANFPSKAAIYVDEVAGIDEPDEYGLHSPTYTAGFYALLWLEEEGYIRYADVIRQDGVDQATLTHKAFVKLTEISGQIVTEEIIETDQTSNIINLLPAEDLSPSVLEDRMMVINQLRTALRSGSSIATTKIIRHILGAD